MEFILNSKKVTSIVLNNFTNDSRVLKEAISLQNAGYDVKVVALYENGLEEFEEIQEISIHRMKLKSKEWSKSGIVQLFKYFEFLYRAVKEYKTSDILHCNDLNALPIGVMVKKFFNKEIKIVYDAHEYETQRHGMSLVKRFVLKRLESYFIKYANRVITVSPSIALAYSKDYGIEKPALVLNTPFYKEVKSKKNLFREKFNISEDTKLFLYQGVLNRGRGIETLLEIFEKIEKDVAIIFMGKGILESTIKKSANSSKNIYLHESVSPTVVLDYTSSADFGFSLIEDSCLSYRYSLPNKMFEYIMVGLPIIVSDLPEMRLVVERYKVGVVVKDSIEKAITDALEINIEDDDFEKARKIYNWKEQEKVLLGVYNEL